MGVWNGVCQARIHNLLNGPCKCKDGTCYANLLKTEVVELLDQFEKRTKLEQDSILFLACSDPLQRGRNEYVLLGKHMRRACWEQLMGISSHRVDKIGAVDQRYGSRGGWKQSPLTSSIDSFCMVLYNSIAEPLPTKFLECCLLCVLFGVSNAKVLSIQSSAILQTQVGSAGACEETQGHCPRPEVGHGPLEGRC